MGQTRNHAKHPALLPKFQIGLQAHQIKKGALPVFGAQLEHRPGPVAGAGIPQAHRLHRAEADGVVSPGGQHLDGHTALVHLGVPGVKAVDRRPLGVYQLLHKAVVLLLIHGAVEIVPLFPILVPPAVAGGGEAPVHIQTLPGNNGGRRVEKAQTAPAQGLDFFRQGLACQRPSGHNHRPLGNGAGLLPLHGNQGLALNGLSGQAGKLLPVHSQGAPGRHGGLLRAVHQQRAKTAHLFLQKTGGAVDAAGLQGVGADQLREALAVVGRGKFLGLHLHQGDGNPLAGQRPGGLAPSQARPQHGHVLFFHISPRPHPVSCRGRCSPA